ncbi:hypothetical protein HPP92_009865 [Vanilla planifolia]|uniref:Phytocyanin domain-containing protein n=1 Tax=Vanilla planifolia TaxID=51239 RepID=A0A835V7D9_VANPL|nr:hypothetical protein HPP92_009865 [Vanilla planifolia]
MARVLFLAGVFLALIHLAPAYDFYVGGRDGWVAKPAESYNLWAESMRFQVGDKLVFIYKTGKDSVLLVKEEDYNSCNTQNPIKKFDDGHTIFQFNRSGPFFFISGAAGHCSQGQKLVVVVMATRKPIPPPTSSPPHASPPSVPSPAEPPSSSPSPSPAPGNPSQPPAASPPSPTPSPRPSSAHNVALSRISNGFLALFLGAVFLG